MDQFVFSTFVRAHYQEQEFMRACIAELQQKLTQLEAEMDQLKKLMEEEVIE